MAILRRLFGSDEAPNASDGHVTGLAGQATVISLRDGGPYVNGRPTITMDLDVEVAGRERYRAKARQTVGRLVIGRLQPGATIPVRVKPNEHEDVVEDEAAMLGESPPEP